MNNDVSTPSSQVLAMAAHWPLIEALLGGTPAMRAAKDKLMPRQPRELDEDYQYRLSTATLFPAFARTVGVMTGKPFSKEITLGDDVPGVIAALAPDIDGDGHSLHSFAVEVFAQALAYGLCGILAEHTARPEHSPSYTLADARLRRDRPYWIFVRHDQILGWRFENKNGLNRLTQLRIDQSVTVDEGEFGARLVRRVCVYTPGAWQLFEQKGQAWEIVESGQTTLAGIPFVPVYGRKTGYMQGVSPLLDLAYQNVKHWQDQSDQDDSARFARKRILVVSGADDVDSITASSSSALKLPPGSDARIVQGSAESVAVGRSELEALEAQMIQTGAELLTEKPGSRTATEAANDAQANKSDLQRIVESFEDALDQALQFTADWLGLPDGGHVSLFKDFAAGSLSDASAQLLLGLQQGGVITKETLIREQQRRGVLSPDIDPAQEIAAVQDEGPPLGMMMGAAGGNGSINGNAGGYANGQ